MARQTQARSSAVRFLPLGSWGRCPVTTGPQDPVTAGMAGRGHLRASHADRELVIDVLKAAFIQGRLTKDELTMRVGQAFASRTYADLAALTADIPAGLSTAKPAKLAAAAGGQPVLRPGPVITAATALYAGVWAYVLFLSPDGGDSHSAPSLILGGFIVYLAFCLSRWGMCAPRGVRSAPAGRCRRGQRARSRRDRSPRPRLTARHVCATANPASAARPGRSQAFGP